MTDGEMIIKTLECRIDKFSKDVLTLIKRKDAEIECLQHYKSLYKDLKAEHLETIKRIKLVELSTIKKFENKLIDIAVGNWSDTVNIATISDAAIDLIGGSE